VVWIGGEPSHLRISSTLAVLTSPTVLEIDTTYIPGLNGSLRPNENGPAVKR
jgi:hypothetical protein